ncbi:hypothetical protein KSF_094780 [Reticulibacter mediterranei]|uniref:DUF72 domain-containing protein n=1 Tax=Reticulibacter mediterranei TaxID=2778369 RepID=A0A8J3N8D9_9CHLR|nr:DUF72 domain-containing protein [Reticulibacter mediterranei]GHO99430.1 hypothetical protein KSF_094780 [Reticulibacter mediterranei]
MIWIGTSGWIYPHWIGRFYPSDLPVREHLAYYAQHFSTVELNNSFYRLPSYEQFQRWGEQTHRGFCFAVKASRFITHLKKLQGAEEGINRLYSAAGGLGTHIGPFLYQLPPHWHMNLQRLQHFIARLPGTHKAAFEFRDPSWFQTEALPTLRQLLEETGCTLVVAVGGTCPIPADIPPIGPFGYIRIHHGEHGVGLSDSELEVLASRVFRNHTEGRDLFVYFNNDAEGHAIADAQRLQALLGDRHQP